MSSAHQVDEEVERATMALGIRMSRGTRIIVESNDPRLDRVASLHAAA